MQSKEHLAVVGREAEADLDVLENAPEGLAAVFIEDVKLPSEQSSWASLKGPHNLANAKAAVAACQFLGLDNAAIAEGLTTFHGLPHRMEVLGTFGGVTFVNDSKATNPASTAPALAAYPRVHWIVGGLPKGDDLDECAPHFGHVATAYTIGEAGPHFAEILAPVMHVERCEMLCEAVQRAMAAAKPGEVILLSPAAPASTSSRTTRRAGRPSARSSPA
jgi:UDP-N-acetylmuramoylalanine--D-glutamate ligase